MARAGLDAGQPHGSGSHAEHQQEADLQTYLQSVRTKNSPTITNF